MYSPEIIRQINAENKYSIHSRDSVIDDALLKIKCALNDAVELENEIKTARRLKKTNPERTTQLELAEAFYTARRRSLLNLQDTAFALKQALDDGIILTSRYEDERLVLEGRLFAAKASGNSKLFEQITPEYGLALSRLNKVKAVATAIEETLTEYSIEYSRPLSDVAHLRNATSAGPLATFHLLSCHEC